MSETLVVFQGGGPTAVINATLAGVLEAANGRYSKVLGLKHSLEFAGLRDPIDLSDLMSPNRSLQRARLCRTMGAGLGSSREKVTETHYAGLLDTMQKTNARHIIGIGGNGTMHTLHTFEEFAKSNSVELCIAGVPKTVDNDLPGVAFAPGFGSAARFIALAVRDFDCDFRAMQTFDDVTILETMGRDTGWLAAASVLLREDREAAPHIVLVPERPVDVNDLLCRIVETHREIGRVFVITNEMLKLPDGAILGSEIQDGPVDALGRTMYSLSIGTGNYLAGLIWKKTGLRARCLRPGSLGRAMSCCVSNVDRDLAVRTGKTAIDELDRTRDCSSMVTVSDSLELGCQPIRDGCGKASLPGGYLDPCDNYDISPDFSRNIKRIIGATDPVDTFIGR